MFTLENKANKTELNNYSYLGNLATRIPKNDDLNNYITPGIYTCSSIDIAKTLLNLPTGIDSSFRLEVIINTGDETNLFGSQEMRTNSNKIFIRTIRGTGGWSAWRELATMDNVPESDTNPAELDTNKYIKSGFYSIGDVTNRTNLPMQYIGTLLVHYAGCYVIQEYFVNGNLRRFMRRSVDDGKTWSNWLEYAKQKDLDELFQSVSSGKTLVANAITDKGVSTATDATFATMATNVGKITNYTASEKQALATAITNKGVSTSSTDSFSTMATNVGKINTNGYKEETASWDKTSTGANRIVFTFSADVYGVKQITPPSDASSHIVPEMSTSMFTINGNKLTLYVNGVGMWTVTALIKQ